MRAFPVFSLFCLMAGAPFADVPDIDSFRPVPQYPRPAAGASLALAAPDSGNGRLVLWDGDTVYYQENTLNVNGADLDPVATGYLGDPAFVALHSRNRLTYLGSGVDGLVYEIPNIQNPQDFATGAEFDVVTFFSGGLLNDAFFVLDRERDDMTGAEIVVTDIALAKADDPDANRAVVQKPAGSAPAAIFVDRNAGRVYITDPASGELRWFASSALQNAFTTMTPLDWTADGTLVGTAGQFLRGGVYGVNPDNELIIGGDTGTPGTGGIQYVSMTNPPAIVDTLDPAGTGPAYVLVYSRARDLVLAIDPSVSPPVAYASTNFIPAIQPDSVCDDFDEILLEHAAFLDAFAPGMTDLDGDSIRDSAMLQLYNLYACRANDSEALAMSTDEAYDDNREVFATEANAMVLDPYARILPTLLSLNQAMRTYVLTELSNGGTPLTGSYVTISCADMENCLPEFVEDPFFTRSTFRGMAATEPYFATGDPDGDGLTNIEEYNNNEAKGGDDLDFAVAAADELLDGSAGRINRSGCFIATAAYGTPMAAELDTLRGARDEHLLTSAWGSAFCDAYYRMSPTMAAWIADRPDARAAVRFVLLPFVSPTGTAVTIGILMMFVAGAAALRASRKPTTVQRK